jgi:hypothetical protein
MAQSIWRAQFSPIIARILAEHAAESQSAKRQAVKDHWHWGDRRSYQYTVYIDELQRQLGEKEPSGKPGWKRGRPRRYGSAVELQGTLGNW